MGHRVVRGGKDWWFISGRGHSWGSFGSWAAANDWLKQVEADNKAYRERMAAARIRIYERIEQQDADRIAYQRAQREADDLLYGGSR